MSEEVKGSLLTEQFKNIANTPTADALSFYSAPFNNEEANGSKKNVKQGGDVAL